MTAVVRALGVAAVCAVGCGSPWQVGDAADGPVFELAPGGEEVVGFTVRASADAEHDTVVTLDAELTWRTSQTGVGVAPEVRGQVLPSSASFSSPDPETLELPEPEVAEELEMFSIGALRTCPAECADGFAVSFERIEGDAGVGRVEVDWSVRARLDGEGGAEPAEAEILIEVDPL